MKLGSPEHKELFCRSFIDTHLQWEPNTLPWPQLDSISLERLRATPFQQGRGLAIFRVTHSVWHYTKALQIIIRTFKGDEKREEEGFTISGASTFMDDLTPELFISTCLTENAKRMSRFDSRLLQPRFIPGLSKAALGILKRLHWRQPKPAVQQS